MVRSAERRAKINRLRQQNNRNRQLVRELVQARKDAGMSQKAIAKELEVNQSAISRFENYLVAPRLDFIRDYAEAVERDVHFDVRFRSGKVRLNQKLDASLSDFTDSGSPVTYNAKLTPALSGLM